MLPFIFIQMHLEVIIITWQEFTWISFELNRLTTSASYMTAFMSEPLNHSGEWLVQKHRLLNHSIRLKTLALSKYPHSLCSWPLAWCISCIWPKCLREHEVFLNQCLTNHVVLINDSFKEQNKRESSLNHSLCIQKNTDSYRNENDWLFFSFYDSVCKTSNLEVFPFR